MLTSNQDPKDVTVVIIEPCVVEGQIVERDTMLVLLGETGMCLAGSGRARLASPEEVAEAARPKAKAPAAK